jgi:predicted regulator of Ras-like GTPase activity (Roadblock/LC7/MglB family)
MFGFLKNLLRRSGDDSGDAQSYEPGDQPAYSQPAPRPITRKPLISANRTNGNGKLTGNGNLRPHPRSGPAVSEHQKMVDVPLRVILPGLPLEVQSLIQPGDFFDAVVPVPLERILGQLSRGSVRINFGDLRSAVPDAFSDDPSQDKVLITLPLGEVLSRINPALIQRRRTQKTVEVPPDIVSPFDPRSQGLIFAVGPAKEAPQAAPPARQTSPLPPAASGRQSTLSSAAPTPPGLVSAPQSLAANSRPANFAPVVELPVAPPIAMPQVPAAPVPAPAPVAATPVAPETIHEPVGEPIVVGLTTLAESWPDSIRKEIVDLHLVEARVDLPVEAVEKALKQGRIAFSWKTLRSWIRSATLSGGSAHDAMLLELPLKVVAPLFLARQKEATKDQQRVVIDAEIPNLFFGSPQNELQGQHTVTKPADTNYYVWDDVGDTAKVDMSEVRRGPSPGTKFVAKYATPNEIVSRAAGLEGVAGAIIALPDGLMVANSVPADLNPDTVAAFLPQIFGKVSQCTKELRMGELNNLNFTVGNVPWKIFRVNAIFFAAFGREGQGLPTARLAALAAELDHKPK